MRIHIVVHEAFEAPGAYETWAASRGHRVAYSRVYLGDATQSADPLIAATEALAPAYRGLAYVVLERFAITPFGNRLPNFSFELTA